ncbi:hypothetical protein FACS189411_01700 [Bacteroidia bacterium]|nr:hypothetical protein FACS189411_01700 [Bacteroidia bacterium]
MGKRYGINDLSNIIKERDIVRCNNCYHYFYDELIDVENNDTLILFPDGKDFFCKGCPICKTDDYLMDVDNFKK